MQPPGTAELLTGSLAAASPQKPSRVCEIGSIQAATATPAQGADSGEIREPSGYREKPPRTGGQKSGTSNAGKALFNGIIRTGERVYNVSRIDLDIFKIGNHY